MAAKFGTSGLRGLVVELTTEVVSAHVAAFIKACPTGSGLYVGRDLRPSSPEHADVVMRTAAGAGLAVTDCGETPTPALALAAMKAGAASVMVTGSHIPADRNGLKFYTPTGEITKSDETAILAALAPAPRLPEKIEAVRHDGAGREWVRRTIGAYGPSSLAGMKIGLWAHSAVSRDLIGDALRGLGAEVIQLDRSHTFIPVDTEAVPDWARDKIAAWVKEHRFDALVSTDGDGDRPLVADETGRVVPGDLLGQITAAAIGADIVVTPVSSNTGVEQSGRFSRVVRTRIGSPFVIAAMAEAGGRVIGYEANGGVLLGFDAAGPAGPLLALATRDSLLPIVATLHQARAAGTLSARVALEPRRFTAADRLENVPTERVAGFIAEIATEEKLAAFFSGFGEVPVATDRTDGLRIACASGRIVHFRPSGNAPELRIYVETEEPGASDALLREAFSAVNRWFEPSGGQKPRTG